MDSLFPELTNPLAYCLKKYGLYVFYLLLLAGFALIFKRYGLKGLLPAVVGIYGLIMVLAYAGQEVIIYFPHRQVTATPAEVGLAYEEAWLETSDGETLQAWFIPGQPGAPVVLFCHGNASSLSDPSHLEIIRLQHSLGLSVFLFDYRGFGRSSGSPSEQGTYLDGRAAWRYLVEDKGFKAADIIIWGRSLGGGVASLLADRVETCRALVLESTFTSIPDMSRRLFPFLPAAGIRHRYPVREHVKGAKCPVLVMHSRQDETVPYDMGREVFKAAPEPKRFLELRGGHAWGFLVSKERYLRAVEEFLLEPD